MFPGQPTDIREVRAAPGRECVPLNLPATLHFGARAQYTTTLAYSISKQRSPTLDHSISRCSLPTTNPHAVE